jgi:hypothetical protein
VLVNCSGLFAGSTRALREMLLIPSAPMTRSASCVVPSAKWIQCEPDAVVEMEVQRLLKWVALESGRRGRTAARNVGLGQRPRQLQPAKKRPKALPVDPYPIIHRSEYRLKCI